MRAAGLETGRLTLGPATEADVDALWAIWRDPDVRRYLFDDVPVTRERAAEIVSESACLAADGLGVWTLRTRRAPAIIGCVGLLRTTTLAALDPRLEDAVEVLASLAPEFWGSGYATEALGALVAHAFGTLDLQVLVAATDLPNSPSQRLLGRLGFAVTGECDGPRYRLRTYALDAGTFREVRKRAPSPSSI